MPLWAFFLFFLGAFALAPVKDFRVADIASVKIQNKAAAVSTLTTSSASAAATIAVDSLVELLWTDDSNSIYYINVTIADSASGYAQEFPLLFDTGSGIAWVYNSSCTSAACANAPAFNDTRTPTTNTAFSLKYSGETVEGSIVAASENNLTWTYENGMAVTNMSFGLADAAPSFFSDYNISGILGILTLVLSENALVQLKAAGAVASNLFALILDPPANAAAPCGGLIVWGDLAVKYAPLLAKSAMTYASVVANAAGYWLISVKSLQVEDSAGDVQQLSSNSSVNAIVDTGTTGLALPLAAADRLHELLFGDAYVTDGSGNYAFLCNATGEVEFTLASGANLTMAVSSILADAYTSTSLAGYCASKVQGVSGSTYWILGASFLSSFYTVFDLEQSRIGFAPKVDLYVTTTKLAAATSSTASLAYLTAHNLTLTQDSGAYRSTGYGAAAMALVGLIM